jgi:hypothetical protein
MRDTGHESTPTPAAGPQTIGLQLERAARLTSRRLAELEERVQQGDAGAWPDFFSAAQALAALVPVLAPGSRGELLTTAQMAERLNVAPKTLLRRKARGEIRPALQRGKLIRWRGDEVPR